jgi:hypothetical protein
MNHTEIDGDRLRVTPDQAMHEADRQVRKGLIDCERSKAAESERTIWERIQKAKLLLELLLDTSSQATADQQFTAYEVVCEQLESLQGQVASVAEHSRMQGSLAAGPAWL